MKAYYGSRISENMTVTPEGFLICHNVPIARTGTQEYLPSELGKEGRNPIPVMREAGEVFSAATLASFEGKPVTLDHPALGVEPGNANAYIKGHVQNVRQGTGEESHMILSDLFITDPQLIRLIREDALREVSCGYTCEYGENPDGMICQRSIRGNHVAVVKAGRAGERVAIKDAAATKNKNGQEGRSTHLMNKKPKSTLLNRIFAGWAKDADPGEIAEALDELVEQAKSEDEAPSPAPTPTPADQDPTQPAPPQQSDSHEALSELIQVVQSLAAKLDALTAAKGTDTDPLQKLEDELAAQQPTGDNDESKTIEADEEPEVKDEEPSLSAGENGPVSSPASRPENPIPGADSAVMLAAVQAIKPIIAKLPAAERKQAADAAARGIRAAMGKTAKPQSNDYNAINQMRGRTADANAAQEANDAQIGRDIAAKHNPHYKAKGGK